MLLLTNCLQIYAHLFVVSQDLHQGQIFNYKRSKKTLAVFSDQEELILKMINWLK